MQIKNVFIIFFIIITLDIYAQSQNELSMYYDYSINHLNKTYQYDSAIFFADKGIVLANTLNKRDTLSKFYRLKGLALSRSNKYTESIEILKKAIEPNIELKDYKARAKNTNTIGATYYRQGNTNKAIEYYKQALEYARANECVDIISASLNNLGVAYKKIGQYVKATEYLIEALEVAQNNESSYNEAQALNNLAQCYAVAGNYNLSNNYYNRERDIRNAREDYKGIINIDINIGVNFSKLMQKDSALHYYFLALNQAEKINDKYLMSVVYSNIAAIYNYNKKHDSALSLLKKAYNLNKELNRTKGIINTNINLAGTYFDLKDYQKTKHHFNEALELAQNSNLIPEVLNLYNSLSDFYANTNNFSKAFEYKNMAYQLSDTLMNSEVASKMEEMQIQYETEQKEKQIAELIYQQQIKHLESQRNKRNFIIVVIILLALIFAFFMWYKYKQTINKNNEDKLNQRLLRSQMNPHFIFNSLNSVNSFILDNKPKDASNFLLKFSQLMRNILQSSRNDYTSLEKEIETLENYLNLEQLRFKNNLNYEIEVDDKINQEEIDIPPMLIQPFIENSIKHAFHDQNRNNKVTIRFLLEDYNHLRCEITDNGIGVESKENIPAKNHISYAIQITKERLKILNKKRENNIIFSMYDLKHEGKQGTKVVFTFPV